MLYANYFFVYEANKLHVGGRRSINPFLIVNRSVRFAYSLRGTAKSINHHLFVHAHQSLMVFNRLLQLGRQRIDIRLRWRLDRKVDERRKQFLHIGCCHLRNVFREDECKRTSGIVDPLFLMDRNHSAASTNLHVVVPVSLLLGASVYVENNLAVLDHDVRDLKLVAWLGCRSVSCNLHRNGLVIRRDLPIARQLQALLTLGD